MPLGLARTPLLVLPGGGRAAPDAGINAASLGTLPTIDPSTLLPAGVIQLSPAALQQMLAADVAAGVASLFVCLFVFEGAPLQKRVWAGSSL